MTDNNLWLLPDGVQELDSALGLEILRRKILDNFFAFGYELVHPPLFEFLDSLLIGSGNNLDLDTIKITDQVTGRLMGLRADITPQIARISAQSNKLRLCYVGDTAIARYKGSNRIPMQIGAELYGYHGIDSDIEVIKLMLASLALAGIDNIYLDIGHVEIFRKLVQNAQLSQSQEQQLLIALQKKSKIDCQKLLDEFKVNKKIAIMIMNLIDLHGGAEVLEQARKQLDSDIVGSALDEISSLGHVHSNIHYDLSELRGYSYHTGLIFGAYVEHSGGVIAKGGRYDAVSEQFNKKQAAIGFSADLLLLDRLNQKTFEFNPILAPNNQDDALQKTINQLRSEGEAVVVQLQTDENFTSKYRRELILKHNKWQIIEKG